MRRGRRRRPSPATGRNKETRALCREVAADEEIDRDPTAIDRSAFQEAEHSGVLVAYVQAKESIARRYLREGGDFSYLLPQRRPRSLPAPAQPGWPREVNRANAYVNRELRLAAGIDPFSFHSVRRSFASGRALRA